MNDRELRVFHMVGMFFASLENTVFCILILGEAFFQMSDHLEFAEGMEGVQYCPRSRTEEGLG